MRMELTDNIANGARRLFEFGRGLQSQLTHGIDNAPLHRLEPIAHVRERSIENDVHGIIQVGLLSIEFE